MDLPVEQITDMAQNGSPVLLQAVGRVFGLGQAERTALVQNGLPRWSLYLVTAALGVAAGIYIHRNWPRQVDRMMGAR